MRPVGTKTDSPPPGASTQYSAEEFNEGLSFENQNTVESSGQTLDAGDQFQQAKAIATYAARGDYYTDTGAADAYVLTPQGAMQAPWNYALGMRVRFAPANANTGASTINVGGVGASTITKGGDALTGGELLAGVLYTLVYNGTSFDIQPAQNFLASGLRVREFYSSTSFTVPDGVTRLFLGCIGGGGGGARGSTDTTNSATGGGGGEYAHGWFDVSPGDTVTVTIGAGGAAGAGANANGSPGGTSSLAATGNTTITAIGGSGGVFGSGGSIQNGGAGGTGGTGGTYRADGGRGGNTTAAGARATGGGAPGSMFGDGGHGGDADSTAQRTGGGAPAQGHGGTTNGGKFGRTDAPTNVSGTNQALVDFIDWPISICRAAIAISYARGSAPAAQANAAEYILAGGSGNTGTGSRADGSVFCGGGATYAGASASGGFGFCGGGGGAVTNGSVAAGSGGAGWAFIMWQEGV